MKLGEIKLESLRLMNANDEDLSIENIENYRQDDRYKDYLDRMPGAINRAIVRFLIYKAIPTKLVEIKPSQGKTLKQYIKFNLKELILDFNSLIRVSYINERVVPNINYETISDGVVVIPFSSSNIYKGRITALPTNPCVGDTYNVNGDCKSWNGTMWEILREDEIFCIEYIPVVQNITANTNNNTEINLPQQLATIIPYFVKADLYEQDEPELAATSRNIFESALTEYVSFGLPNKQNQQYVENVMW